jgi:hypothetical protein
MLRATAKKAVVKAPPKWTSLAQTSITKPKGVCIAFQKNHKCRFGDKCKYSHYKNSPPAPKDNPKAKPKAKHRAPADTPCRFFRKGDCRFGDSCRYKHEATQKEDEKKEQTKVMVCNPHKTIQLSTTTEEWVLDSGSSVDVRKSGSSSTRNHNATLPQLETAGGRLVPDSTVTAHFDHREENSECIELESTKNAFTVGKRCAKYRYDFHWKHLANKPIMRRPDRELLEVGVEQYVPFLDMDAKPEDVIAPRNVTVMPCRLVDDDFYGVSEIQQEAELVDADSITGSTRVFEGGKTKFDDELQLEPQLQLGKMNEDEEELVLPDSYDVITISHFLIHLKKCVKGCRAWALAKPIKYHSQRWFRLVSPLSAKMRPIDPSVPCCIWITLL